MQCNAGVEARGVAVGARRCVSCKKRVLLHPVWTILKGCCDMSSSLSMLCIASGCCCSMHGWKGKDGRVFAYSLSFNAGVAWTPDDDELWVCNPAKGIVRVTRSGEEPHVREASLCHPAVNPGAASGASSRGDKDASSSGGRLIFQRSPGWP